nr:MULTISPECIES: enoyl-CoA hydratase-related protein [unclassified Pseudomonas]
MNRSGVIFVAALNGSALGLGSELALACDVRLMADGEFFIGQPEVLLGILPGGGALSDYHGWSVPIELLC